MTDRTSSAMARLDDARASLGALIGIAVTGLVVSLLGVRAGGQYLLAPMGAAAVLLFAVPESPLARAYNVIVGNAASAAVGVLTVRWVSDPVLAAALACALAIAAMSLLGALHPPGGAVAMTAVIGGPMIAATGFWFVGVVVVNSIALLGAAAIWRRLPSGKPGQTSSLITK